MKKKQKINLVFPTMHTENISSTGEKIAHTIWKMKKELVEQNLDVVMVLHTHKGTDCTVEILATTNDPRSIFHVLHGAVEAIIKGVQAEAINSN